MIRKLIIVLNLYLTIGFSHGLNIFYPEGFSAYLPGLKKYCISKSCVDYCKCNYKLYYIFDQISIINFMFKYIDNLLRANMNTSVDPCKTIIH